MGWRHFIAPKSPPDELGLGPLGFSPAEIAALVESWPQQPSSVRERENPEPTDAGIDFGLRLQRQLGSACPHENLVISPISLQLLLAMAATGARGATQQELGLLLGLDKVAAEWPAFYAEIMPKLRQSAGTHELRLANSIWVNALCHVRSEFERQCHDSFDAEVASLDFHSPDAIARINAWASQRTNGKINVIVNGLSDQAAMLLVNCVYFYGKWETPFRRLFTRKERFHALSGDVRRPFMHQKRRFSYQETEEFQAVRLSYGHPSTLCLAVYLPKAQQGLENFVNGLDAERWQTMSRGFSDRYGALALPRFRIESNLGMRSALQTLGITKCFLPQDADFSGMLTELTPFWLDDVLQKTYLDVNERGTEAAAVTPVYALTETRDPRPEEPFRMIVDRPFFAAITDLHSESLLFTASVWNV